MSEPLVIASSNLSHAWGKALLGIYDRPRSAEGPLLLSISGFHNELPDEDPNVRGATDELLNLLEKVPVNVSALTIFPFEMWCRRNRPSSEEFSRLCIHRLLPRLQRLDQRNRRGTYFSRMMAFTGAKDGELQTIDQLSFVISLMSSPDRRPRQSALQIACFDPAKDHSRQTRLGFPCLQQVSLTYQNEEQIAINAYYPTQFIFDRAYGNYLGLCQLGAFIAHQTGLRFSQLNCFVGRPDLGDVSKHALSEVVDLIRDRINRQSKNDGGSP